MKNIFVSLTILLLFGCAHTSKVIPETPQKPRERPVEAMLVCVPTTELTSVAFGAVVRKLNEAVTNEQVCRSKHAQLVEWINAAPEYSKPN